MNTNNIRVSICGRIRIRIFVIRIIFEYRIIRSPLDDNGDDEGDYSDGDDHQGHVEKIEEMLLWSFGDRLQGKVEETIARCL